MNIRTSRYHQHVVIIIEPIFRVFPFLSLAPVSKKKSVAPLMVDGREHLPFQLQITYTARDGSKCLRVVSQAMPVTKNREEAEKSELFMPFVI